MHKAGVLNQREISTKKAILFSLVLSSLVLISLEGAIRVWAYYFRTPYERYNPTLRRYALIPNTRFAMPDGKEFVVNSRGFAGPEFEAQPSEGVYRIFALGDSCTLGYWKYVYPSMLQDLLNSTHAGKKYEIINAGIEGYNSEYALARLKEDILQYSPRMVTIYIGWNDLMKIDPTKAAGSASFAWISRLLERSYLAKAYKKVIFFYLRPLILRPALSATESDDHSFDDFVPVGFRQNVEGMIEILREKDITPVLFTLPTVVTPDMSYEELQRHRVFFPYYAGSYSVARFLSLHRAYNNVIRSIGSQRHVAVVDLDAIFNRHDTRDLFWDTMHPSAKGQRLIAESLAQKLQELLKREERRRP